LRKIAGAITEKDCPQRECLRAQLAAESSGSYQGAASAAPQNPHKD
jgi:hypothetical protein